MYARETTTPRPFKLLVLGDSITKAYTHDVFAKHYYTARLQTKALAAKINMIGINCGNSGWTTTQLLAITASRLQRFNPDALLFYAGVNDPGAAIAGATTQANIQSVIDTALTATSLYPVPCKTVIIANTNYHNYPAGSLDNVNTGTYYATNATLRTYQAAAAAYGVSTYGASRVIYADIFSYYASLITAGTVTQGDWAKFHILDQNQHNNGAPEGTPSGQDYAASFFLSVLQNAQGGKLLDPYRIH